MDLEDQKDQKEETTPFCSAGFTWHTTDYCPYFTFFSLHSANTFFSFLALNSAFSVLALNGIFALLACNSFMSICSVVSVKNKRDGVNSLTYSFLCRSSFPK